MYFHDTHIHRSKHLTESVLVGVIVDWRHRSSRPKEKLPHQLALRPARGDIGGEDVARKLRDLVEQRMLRQVCLVTKAIPQKIPRHHTHTTADCL
jgi:hypothetical protein